MNLRTPESSGSATRPDRTTAAPTTQAVVKPAIVVAPGTSSKPPVIVRTQLHPLSIPQPDLTDEQIGHAIQNGVDYVMRQFNHGTHLLDDVLVERNGYAPGIDALSIYALLQCSQAIKDPRIDTHEPEMRAMIAALKDLPLGNYYRETYARSLRASALSIYDRKEDRQALTDDVNALIRGMHDGAYTYRLAQPRQRMPEFDGGRWDNSNSQYGLLGVWSGAETGREVPQRYWEAVRKHWEAAQQSDGQWAYAQYMSMKTHSMTCAGLASLFVAHDYLEPAHFTGAVGRDPYSVAVGQGLRWLESGDNCLAIDHAGYDLYGLERVGLASGFKYFGSHDWYRELARNLITSQRRDGSWGGDGYAAYGPQVETPYCLLFLARGRHPILMNKLRTAGDWANRPRDVANLARFASHELERPLNWQVVPLNRPFQDWMDSPILYLASDKPVVITEEQIENIRQFVYNGGLLFTQADGNSAAFNVFAQQLARRLFPDYEMQDLPENHAIYNVMFHVPRINGMKYVTNGSRMFMLHSNTDISAAWERRDDKFKPIPFHFGANLFVFASGDRDLRNRLTSTYLPTSRQAPSTAFRVARLSYAGNWNPEPAAWTRFSRWFNYQTGYGLKIDTVLIKDLKPRKFDIAVLTGAQEYELTDEEAMAIKSFAEAGGVVLIDTCGGSAAFDHGLESSLYFKMFATAPASTITLSHPLMTDSAPGMRALGIPKLRGDALTQLGSGAGYLKEISIGRGHILYTSLDFTTALLGTHAAGIIGYDPDYAMALVKNTILWTADGQKDE